MKNYKIYKGFGKESIENKDILRVDLFNGFKIKDIPELKKFNFIYEQSGHNDGQVKIRYIRVFRKE